MYYLQERFICSLYYSLRFRRNAWYDDACESQRNRTQSSDGKGSHRKEPEETDYESGEGFERRAQLPPSRCGSTDSRIHQGIGCPGRTAWRLVPMHRSVPSAP